jgi:hypothetical protein
VADDDLFFVSRGGHIWACWLSGKPAVDLGVDTEVTQAMTQFLQELRARVSSGAPIEAPPPPSPQPAPVVPPAPPPAVLKPRAADRHDLTILGRIFTARGSRDVTILDLSETGCQFHAAGSQLKADNRLTIKLGPVGPIEATVRWNRGDRHGVQFNSPLYPSVLQHIRDHFDLRKR